MEPRSCRQEDSAELQMLVGANGLLEAMSATRAVAGRCILRPMLKLSGCRLGTVCEGGRQVAGYALRVECWRYSWRSELSCCSS